MYISTSDELRAFCERIRGARVVAVDTEFLREKTYHPRLCLVQVGTDEETAAVDPIQVDDLSPLAEILEDERVTKVFHACGQDLEALFVGLGATCAPVFDTQVAAAFLGMRQQVSYASLVEAYTGVRLPKAESLTDWSHRPLDPEQLVYAEDDVRYLPAIYETMMKELVRRDRLSWLEPEMAAVTQLSHVMRAPREAYLRLKRSKSLTRRQLAIAREVCAWREELASKRDIPRKWIASDEVLVEVCRRAPKTPQALHKIRGTEKLSAESVDQIIQAVTKGEKTPLEDCPANERRSRPSADAESVIELMGALVRVVSEKYGVASQVIASKDDLVDFVQDRESSRLSEGWRKEICGGSLEKLLDGELGLTVRNGSIELI